MYLFDQTQGRTGGLPSEKGHTHEENTPLWPNMEMDNPLFVKENGLPGVHVPLP